MSRINNIGQNGATGDHYLVEKICRIIAGDRSDRVEFPTIDGQRVASKGWQVHVKQAISIIEEVRKHEQP